MTINGILFADATHYQFFRHQSRRLRETGYASDVYSRSLLYVLGVCAETRNHFAELFDLQEHGIRLDGQSCGWQTGTSRKVTRLAFNLWNGCIYDGEEEAEQGTVSSLYAVDELFCCAFQPYFLEAIQIRFPQYGRVKRSPTSPEAADTASAPTALQGGETSASVPVVPLAIQGLIPRTK